MSLKSVIDTKLTMLAASVAIALSASPQLLADQGTAGEEHTEDVAQQLVGTWRLVEASTPGSPSGIGYRLKYFTGTHWMITQPDASTGVVVFHHGGSYALDGNTLLTKTEFAGHRTKSHVGRVGKFIISVDGDTYTQTDTRGVYNETWRRVQAEAISQR